nr:hypothetical protein [Halorhabdus amylolytica]
MKTASIVASTVKLLMWRRPTRTVPIAGAIACHSHSKTEQLEGKPVCTGCAVTERFALKTKYFYDEQNLEAFREEYDTMPIHENAMENKPLVEGFVMTILAIIGLFVTLGVI